MYWRWEGPILQRYKLTFFSRNKNYKLSCPSVCLSGTIIKIHHKLQFTFKPQTLASFFIIYNNRLSDCGDTPTAFEDKIECADGSFADIKDGNWNGCLDKGSSIFRCPYPMIPCQNMRDVDGSKTRDFECSITCLDKGGKRSSCNGGMIL